MPGLVELYARQLLNDELDLTASTELLLLHKFIWTREMRKRLEGKLINGVRLTVSVPFKYF